MSENQVPAIVTEKEQLPMLNLSSGKQSINTATEKVEMQRATAQVYGAIQLAMMKPRDEAVCSAKILELCKNPHFASRALYKVPRGNDVAEGINVHAAHEMARIWGNLQDGFTDHGRYDKKFQYQAFCWDLESNVTYSSPFTVEAVRQYADGTEKEITKLQEIDEMCKARASKETRNAILKAMPFYLKEQVIKECKATIRKEFKDVRATWEGFKKAFVKVGINPKMLLDYLNCKQDKDIDVAHMVDLKIIWESAKLEPDIIDREFPHRDKSKTGEESTTSDVVTEKPGKKPESKKASEDTTKKTESKSKANSTESSEKTKESASVAGEKPPASQSAPAETTAKSTQTTKKSEQETEGSGSENAESESASAVTETESAEANTVTAQSGAESTTEPADTEEVSQDEEDLF